MPIIELGGSLDMGARLWLKVILERLERLSSVTLDLGTSDATAMGCSMGLPSLAREPGSELLFA
jgi:hypothetical protein